MPKDFPVTNINIRSKDVKLAEKIYTDIFSNPSDKDNALLSRLLKIAVCKKDEIQSKLDEKIKNMTPEQYDPKMLWCGFYFVGTGEKDIEKELEEQITLKRIQNSKMDVRYQLDNEIGPNIIQMKENVKDILEKRKNHAETKR